MKFTPIAFSSIRASSGLGVGRGTFDRLEDFGAAEFRYLDCAHVDMKSKVNSDPVHCSHQSSVISHQPSIQRAAMLDRALDSLLMTDDRRLMTVVDWITVDW